MTYIWQESLRSVYMKRISWEVVVIVHVKHDGDLDQEESEGVGRSGYMQVRQREYVQFNLIIQLRNLGRDQLNIVFNNYVGEGNK